MAKAPASSPVEFGTDEWGKWAGSLTERVTALETAVAAMDDKFAGPVVDVRKELDGLKDAIKGVDAKVSKLPASSGKAAATVKDYTVGDDIDGRLRTLETMNGIRPAAPDAEPEQKDGTDGT